MESVEAEAPIIVRSRTAGRNGSHPLAAVREHISRLPDPEVLSVVAGSLNLDPHVLLRFLDQQEHLTPKSRLKPFADGGFEVNIGLDQGNHLMAYLTVDSSRVQGKNYADAKSFDWTGENLLDKISRFECAYSTSSAHTCRRG